MYKRQTVWNAIVSFLSPLLTGIQTRMSTAWNAIKTVISTVLSDVYKRQIYQILPQLIELWGLNVQTEVESRKNLAKVSGK